MWLGTRVALAFGILVSAALSGLADSITPQPLLLNDGSTLTVSSSSVPQAALGPQAILAQNSELGSFRATAGQKEFFMHHPPSLTSEPPPSAVPEPGTMVLFGTGLLAVARAVRRKAPIA